MTRRNFGVLLLLLTVLSGSTRAAYAQGMVPDPAYQALTASDVYVDPRLQGRVDPSTLAQAAMQAQGNPHTQVKIAVLAGLPRGPWRSRNGYAGDLHHELNLDKSGLVLVVLSGPGAGVSVITNGLSADESGKLAHQYAPQIKNDPTGGTAALAEAVAGDINGTEYSHSAWLWVVFLIVVAVVAWLLVSASRRKKQALATARGPVEALRANVLAGIEYIDHYMDVLPKNNPDAELARNARQAASDKFDQAAKILSRATEQTDLNRAQGLLDRAQADIQQARGALDRALGGTSHIPGDDAFRPPPLPQSQQDVNAIPTGQRGVSFFSGEPAPLGALVPVTLTVGGQPRQVYATPEEADALRRGQMPQVRAFNVGGQYVPWYEYNSYDPYRDYWRYENSGWGGFAGGALAGFVGAELLTDMMMPSYGFGGYGGGYGGYAFSPDMGYDNGASYAGADGGYGGPDTGTYSGDQGGGADFVNDYGSQGDPGGGTDFGGGDSGGGADFGGGDFGGGGDSGGGSDF